MRLFQSWGFPGGVVKNPPAKAGDADLMPESRRSPEEGNGNPLLYSCLGNPMDGEAWRAMVHGVEKSQMQLSSSSIYKEKAMATHSCTLAWKIPWTEEPGRLQSMGL